MIINNLDIPFTLHKVFFKFYCYDLFTSIINFIGKIFSWERITIYKIATLGYYFEFSTYERPPGLNRLVYRNITVYNLLHRICYFVAIPKLLSTGTFLSNGLNTTAQTHKQTRAKGNPAIILRHVCFHYFKEFCLFFLLFLFFYLSTNYIHWRFLESIISDNIICYRTLI